MAEISASDLIALVLASSADDKMRERMALIEESIKAHDAARDTALELGRQAQDDLAAARMMKTNAEVTLGKAAQREDALDKRERIIGEINEQVNREKAAFESVRQKVEKDNLAKASELGDWQARLEQREAAVMTRENVLVEKEAEAHHALDVAESMIARVRAAVA
jgi:hypothetical protein